MLGYLFARTFTGTAADLAAAVSASADVRFGCLCYAGYAAFAALEGSGAADIAAGTSALVAAGAAGVDVSVVTSPLVPVPFDPDSTPPPPGYPSIPPKVLPFQAEEAFVGVRFVAGESTSFLVAVSAVDGVVGAALTAGYWEAVVECAADTYDELVDVLANVRSLPQIAADRAALAHFEST